MRTENRCFQVAIQESNIETDTKMPIARMGAVQISQQATIAYKNAITREEKQRDRTPPRNCFGRI